MMLSFSQRVYRQTRGQAYKIRAQVGVPRLGRQSGPKGPSGVGRVGDGGRPGCRRNRNQTPRLPLAPCHPTVPCLPHPSFPGCHATNRGLLAGGGMGKAPEEVSIPSLEHAGGSQSMKLCHHCCFYLYFPS